MKDDIVATLCALAIVLALWALAIAAIRYASGW